LLGLKNVTQQATGLAGLSSNNPNNYLLNPAATNPFIQQGNVPLFNNPNSGIITDLLIVGGLIVGVIVIVKIL
jgi:hypothetical protein